MTTSRQSRRRTGDGDEMQLNEIAISACSSWQTARCDRRVSCNVRSAQRPPTEIEAIRPFRRPEEVRQKMRQLDERENRALALARPSAR